jgi:hypothetical protein
MDPEFENRISPSPKSPQLGLPISQMRCTFFITNLKMEFIPLFKKVFHVDH